jgi:hypothetical protein
LLLTSGDPEGAVVTWAPLHELPEEHALATFARGLEAMIRDEAREAIALLELGIARNTENPPLNRDMRMMIDRLATLEPTGTPTPEGERTTSAVQMLLDQYESKVTKH